MQAWIDKNHLPGSMWQGALFAPIASYLDWSSGRAWGILLLLAYFLACLNYPSLYRARYMMTREWSAVNSWFHSPSSCQCHSCECWHILQIDFLLLWNVCLKLIWMILKRLSSSQRILWNRICGPGRGGESRGFSGMRECPTKMETGCTPMKSWKVRVAPVPLSSPGWGALEVGALNTITPCGLQGQEMACISIGLWTLDVWLPFRKNSFLSI